MGWDNGWKIKKLVCRICSWVTSCRPVVLWGFCVCWFAVYLCKYRHIQIEPSGPHVVMRWSCFKKKKKNNNRITRTNESRWGRRSRTLAKIYVLLWAALSKSVPCGFKLQAGSFCAVVSYNGPLYRWCDVHFQRVTRPLGWQVLWWTDSRLNCCFSVAQPCQNVPWRSVFIGIFLCDSPWQTKIDLALLHSWSHQGYTQPSAGSSWFCVGPWLIKHCVTM